MQFFFVSDRVTGSNIYIAGIEDDMVFQNGIYYFLITK